VSPARANRKILRGRIVRGVFGGIVVLVSKVEATVEAIVIAVAADGAW
jgi:hypothetical protein